MAQKRLAILAVSLAPSCWERDRGKLWRRDDRWRRTRRRPKPTTYRTRAVAASRKTPSRVCRLPAATQASSPPRITGTARDPAANQRTRDASANGSYRHKRRWRCQRTAWHRRCSFPKQMLAPLRQWIFGQQLPDALYSICNRISTTVPSFLQWRLTLSPLAPITALLRRPPPASVAPSPFLSPVSSRRPQILLWIIATTPQYRGCSHALSLLRLPPRI